MVDKNYIRWLDEIDKNDIAKVGGKGANLGEMFQAKIPVPYAYVVTAKTYFDFISQTKIKDKIKKQLSFLDHHDPANLDQTAKNVQKIILKAAIPKNIAQNIMLAYLNLVVKAKSKHKLTEKLSSYLKNPLVAVRSSATAEDLPGASFAGQQETYLNIFGEANVLQAVHKAWASLFTPRAIFYRCEQKFDHMNVGIAVVVQMMVASETSGVMFTIDPVTNDKSKITIEAVFG